MTNASKTSSGSTFFPSGTYKLLRPGCPKAAGTAGKEEEEDVAGHNLHLLCRTGVVWAWPQNPSAPTAQLDRVPRAT